MSCPPIIGDEPLQVHGDSVTLGAALTFSCPEGHHLSGAVKVTCLPSGEFAPPSSFTGFFFFSASVGYSKIFLLCMCFSLFVYVHQVHLSPTKECICKSRSVTNCLLWPVTYRFPSPRRPRGVVQRCPAVPGRTLPRSCHGRAESSAADGQHELSGQGGVYLPVGLPAVWSICPALHCQRNLVGPCPHLSR